MEHHYLQNVYGKIRVDRDVKSKNGIDGNQEKKTSENESLTS